MSSWPTLKNRLCAALFLGAVCTQAAVAVPVLSLTAVPSPAVQGAPLALNVAISGITNLFAYQFSLSFDPTVLQATGYIEGPFLATGGTTFVDGGTIDNTVGKVSFVAGTLIGLIPGVSGNGSLGTLTFNVANPGLTGLNFSNVLFLDASLADITVQAQNTSLLAVSAVPEPATLLLFAAGLAGVGALRSRKAA